MCILAGQVESTILESLPIHASTEGGQSGNILPDWKEQINEMDVLLVLLSDPAYPLLPWSYPNNGHLTHSQLLFKTEVVVEHCYRRLKGRW